MSSKQCRNEANLVVLRHALQASFRRDRVNIAETSRVWAQMPTHADMQKHSTGVGTNPRRVT
jgi:hypothetical protein